MSTEPNRIVLVDETGRIYDRTGAEIEQVTQDDGATLKLFIKPTSETVEANERHRRRLAEAIEQDRRK